MKAMLEQVISLIGALMVLTAYSGQHIRKLQPDHLAYILLNLTGSLILAVVAYRLRQIGLTVVEVSWALISGAAFARYLRQK